jgi:hypothetical protein
LGYGIPPPDPGQYSGRPAREYLRDLTFWLRAVLRWLDRERAPEAGGGTEVIVKTTSSITARSGTTVGSGSAQIVTLSGSTLSTGATITVINVSGGALSTGKYGFAVQIDGVWFVRPVEC